MKNSREIYLDNNATTRPTPEVVEAVVGILASGYGNPSSAHQRGVAARESLETARRRVASLVGASEERVVFTSGGTEANNLALNGLAGKRPGRLVTTETEHSSILKKARVLEETGTEVVYLPVDGSGKVNPDTVRDALENPADLVSVHWVNNETGVEQPVGELGEICRGSGAAFHVDGAQAVGKVPMDFDSMPVDILTFSAHKLHGPQGVGAICFKNPDDVAPVAFGGDQERFVRPGTENLPGIAGFGAAAESRERNFLEVLEHLENMRNTFERRLSEAFPGIRVNGARSPRAGNTSNVLFPGVDGMALMALLDREGVICSQTSACNSLRPEPSHVLLAMGLSESEAFSSVRFSFSALNTIEEAEAAAERVAACCGKLLELEGAGDLMATRFGGHETFAVREGWLSKGLGLIERVPDAFSDPLVADELGVGANMAKSIFHWLTVTGLAERRDKTRSLSMTELGKQVFSHDRYMLSVGTWWALHVNILLRGEDAVVWRVFFNDFPYERFDRATCTEEMRRRIAREQGRVPG